MAEIKTPPVQASLIGFAEGAPGSFRVSDPDEDGEQYFTYVCPCGCGSKGPLIVGKGFKPVSDEPTWEWNGSLDRPSLRPSVWHKGHWHGWLTDGVWTSC